MLVELFEWVQNLDRPFAFLLILPFLVAGAGLITTLKERPWRKREKSGLRMGARAASRRQASHQPV